MMRPRWALLVLIALFAVPACKRKSLPAAPSELTAGIIIYEHADFMGDSAHITRDIADLADFPGPCEEFRLIEDPIIRSVWDDCISSVRVAPGWRATLYRDPGFDDDSLDIVEDVLNLERAPHDCSKGGLNDCVSSIRVREE